MHDEPMAHTSKGRTLAMLASAMLALAACGGSDGGPDGTGNTTLGPPSLCNDAGAPQSAYAKVGTVVGQNGAVTIAACSSSIEAPVWQQTGGPAAMAMLSLQSQTLDFRPPAPGTYRFRVDFRDALGTASSAEVAHEVAAAPSPTQLTLRLSQSVRMGGNVSVRAWPQLQADEAVQSITWAQTEGPVVALDTRDPYVALFVAPQVGRDTLVRLRATLQTTAGRSASDEALVLVERYVQAAPDDGTAFWSGDHVSRVHAYKPTSPYAGALVRCVYDAALRSDNLCPLSTLPFLAQQSGGALPSVDQVMDHVLVSHDWMGRNFEAFLRSHDGNGDFRRMLMSTTAVVLGAQVRPSYYHPGTGAIYLDAGSFWLTPEERDTVNEAPDYRSSFGATLQYTTLWRYVRGNANIFVFYDPRQRTTRGTQALLDEAGWLLLHELGHALDFMPPSAYGTLVNSNSAWGNLWPRYQAGQLTSDFVASTYPLASAAMSGLGQVRFFGAAATTLQESYTPAQVAGFFAADLATDDYAYVSRREDTAMALEEFLMQRRLGIRRDFAIAPRPGPGAAGSAIAVQWGERGRIGEPALRPRLRAIVQQLAPWIDAAEVDLVAAPIAMRSGDSWTSNLVLPGPPPPASPLLAKTEPTLQELWLAEQAQRRRHRLWPAGKALPRAAAGS